MDKTLKERIVLTVNGIERDLEVSPTATLLEVLREDLDLTGAKKACDDGECGSCMVMMGGKAVKTCLLPAAKGQGKELTTIEGFAPEIFDPGAESGVLASGAEAAEEQPLHVLQQAFLEKGATQCGFCIPGMIVKANALLLRNNNPSRDDVIKSLSKNLCRCTGYVKIIDAVVYAGELMRAEAEGRDPVDDTQDLNAANGEGPAVGRSVKRLDSLATVTGHAKYTADLKMDGMLHAKMLRSTHHHARIISIDTSEAEAMSGVEAVLVASDVPGTPYLPNCQPQVHVFAFDKVRFRGEALAAVAAVSEEVAEAAVAKIKVEYEVLPHVIDLEEAVKTDAPRIFDHVANIGPVEEIIDGDIEKAFAEADVVIENTYSVPTREHFAMEPDASLAYEDEDGKLVIKSPLYHAFVQGTESIANNLDMDMANIRIACPHMGGNFGTRGDTLVCVVSALLSLKTKKPVRLVTTREETLLGSCKAPAVVTKYKTAATKDGRLLAVDVEVLHAAGSWAPYLIPTTTQGVELCYFESISTLVAHATGPYKVPHVRARAYDVLYNGPRNVPLRGTNGNYMPLAYEAQMDQIAQHLGIDELDIRLQNVVKQGTITHFGQELKESVGITAELEALRPEFDAAKERLKVRQAEAKAPWKPGLGIGCAWRNIGYVNFDVTAGAELLPDGRIHLLAGTTEQGQGPTTQFAQIGADVVGVPIEMMAVTLGDTSLAPFPVPTFSSITTVATGRAIYDAAENLKNAIIQAGAEILDQSPESIHIKNGVVISDNSNELQLSFKQIVEHLEANERPLRYEGLVEWKGESPNILFGYNAGLVELDVNEETGKVKLSHLVTVSDPGTIVNPQALEGQVDGAVGFGVGFALTESFHPDNPATFEGYGFPSTKDMPEKLTRLFIEDSYDRGPFGAKSCGEHPGLSPIPAIANAVSNAIGSRIYDIPVTPERVKEALDQREAN